VGYNEWEMVTGAVEFSDRNFFGSLTRLDVRLQGSQRGYGALASLSDPFLLNTDVEGTVGGFFVRQELPGYEASFAGGVLGVKRIVQEPNQTGYQAQFEYRAVFDTTIFGLSPEVEQDLNYTVSAVSWNQTLDRRNSPLMPMSGYFLNYELTLASEAFGGDLNFFQPVGQVSWYFPLRQITAERTFVPFVLVNHRSGVILPFAGTGDVPTPERFFLGGPNTIRSFQLDGMAPRDAEGDPIGGEFFWQLNLEGQVPVVGPVYVVGFVDVGNLALTWRDAAIGDTRIAPGVGLRIYTPIGPVYLDYGYNLVRKDGDPIGAVQFGFGFTF
jgi:outer membrane protein assembly factor BamA